MLVSSSPTSIISRPFTGPPWRATLGAQEKQEEEHDEKVQEKSQS